mgnify:CR=1 FL=1
MCKLCEIKPVYEFNNKRKICKTCFINWFQKKFLYTLRVFNMIKSGDIIQYKKGSNFREIALEDVLKIRAERGDVKLVIKNKGKRFAMPSTSDTETHKVINELFNNKLKENKPVNGKIIMPLYLFLDREVLLYAKLRGLKFKEKKEKKEGLVNFVNDLEMKHPELKQAVVSGMLKMK